MSGTFGRILAAREYSRGDSLRDLLEPRLGALLHPGALKNFTPAVERIARAIEDREPFVSGGDYDVDGVTAAAQLSHVTLEFGGRHTTAIPHRLRQGYGAGEFMIEQCERDGAKLLVLSDIGTPNVDVIAKARKRGIEVIVFDHHRPGKTLPDCILVNPLQSDDESGLTMLSAAGLLWHATARIGRMLDPGFDPCKLLDLCTLGTIADLVPLKGQNRILVHHGLPQLSDSPREGIQALKRVMKRGDSLTVGDVGFYLAPAINAAGRLEDALHAYTLLMTDDAGTAGAYAGALRRINETRRALEEKLTVKAETALQRLQSLPEGIVLDDDAFHPGVIGLLASRIAERYHRPTLIFGNDPRGICKGSARAGNAAFDVGLALSHMDELFVKQGGHIGAGGCSVLRENLPADREAWAAEAVQQLRRKEKRAFAVADVEVGLRTIDSDLIGEISTLGPFGMGNPEPVLLIRQLRISKLRELGDGKHLSMTLTDACGCSRRAVLWRHEIHPAVAEDACVDVAAKATTHFFAGKRTVQLELMAVEPAKMGRYESAPR
jgi:single-stranded-DNA-specific exonuclease